MAWFGLRSKRSRSRGGTGRGGARRSSPLSRASELLLDYRLIGRTGLVLLTIAALLVVMRAWEVPFPFREGDYLPHGLASRLTFTRVDEPETQRLREEAALRAPRIFHNDADSLVELPNRFRADLGRVSAASGLDDLSIETRRAFGLVPPPEPTLLPPDLSGGLPSQLLGTDGEANGAAIADEARERRTPRADATPDIRRRFLDLKAAVEPKGQLAAEQRIDGLAASMRLFLQPLQEFGVIDPQDVDDLSLDRDSRLLLVPPAVDAELSPAALGPGLADDALDDAAATGEEDATRGSEGGASAVTSRLPDAAVRDGVRSAGDLTLASGRRVSLSDVQLQDQLTDGGLLGSNWLFYPDFTPELRPTLVAWLSSQVQPTLSYDAAASGRAREAARAAVPQKVDEYPEGAVLVPPRHVLTEDDLPILRAEHAAAEETRGLRNRLARLALVALLLLVLATVNGYHVMRSERRIVRSPRRLALYLGAIVLAVFAARPLSFDPWRAEIIPLVIAAMVFAIAYNQVLASAMAVTLCVLVTLATTSNLSQLVVLMAVTTASVLLIGRVRSRSTLVTVGFAAAAVSLLATIGMRVLADEMPLKMFLEPGVLGTAVLVSVWCVLAGYLVSGSLPIVERLFGVVTDISLLELSDPSHELLQELVQKAPGTYSHSMSVASISESAAEAIGANGLLCRVAAYFHDCGKMNKPNYFIENVPSPDDSKHEGLSPAMSTLVIIGHVKDGVDLAERYNLPQVLIDFIEQHHGTTLVEYFFREAQKTASSEGSETTTEEADFRYPGPKPQTREAACMMIADCCESASRALTDPTPKRIGGLVDALTMKRLLDGQFSECEMTLSEINEVKTAVTKSLTAMYHGRVKYPDAKGA